jgi:putative membrane protein
MKRRLALILAAGLAVTGAALGWSQPARARASAADRQFAREAAQGGMAEVTLGRLAARRGASNAVRRFGKRMVDDHSAANQELKDIARTEGIRLPVGLGKHQATYNRLARLRAMAFDRAYMADMVEDHRMDVAEFRREAAHGSDRDIREFARHTLPTLREHLRMAVDTSRAVGAPRMGRR